MLALPDLLSIFLSEWTSYSLLQGELSDPGIEPTSLAFPTLAGRFFTTSTTREAPSYSPLYPKHLSYS